MKAKQFWNKMAERYDTNVMKRYAEAYQKTIEITRNYIQQDDRLLAVGCGTGIVCNAIAPQVQQITAFDISEKMIEQAQQKAYDQGLSNISFIAANLDDPRIQAGQYTVITAFNVLYFLKDLDQQLARMYAMLPDNGRFLSVTDCLAEEKQKGLKGFLTGMLMKLGMIPYMGYYTTETLVERIKKAGFTVIHTENLFADPPNLYIVARK